MTGEYEDIIHLPHHVSIKHPHMTALARAAQFSPFAALAGYDAAVKETARLTDERLELDEYAISALSDRLQTIVDHIVEQPKLAITYFLPDKMKNGGSYITLTGVLRKVDKFNRLVILADGTTIPIEEIIAIEGEIFGTLNDL